MMNNKIQSFFLKYPSLQSENIFAAAVSGGPDSMALAHLLLIWAQEHQKKIHILTVDHGLRPEAKHEAKMVADWTAGLKMDGVCHQTLVWEGEKPEAAIMEAAREERYRLMAAYCATQGIKTLFVAHHQDDQAETFLIRLSKGSGLNGLAGMSPLRDYNDDLKLARPLLDIPKQELVDYCETKNIPFVHDPSNNNTDYLRPRLRASMDILAEEGLSAKRLATTANRIARAREALEMISRQVSYSCLQDKTKDRYVFDFDRLRQQPAEIGLRVIQSALEDLRTNNSATPPAYNVRMERLEELFDSLWLESADFKPRTLGGCIFSLKFAKSEDKGDKEGKNRSLYIEKEEG